MGFRSGVVSSTSLIRSRKWSSGLVSAIVSVYLSATLLFGQTAGTKSSHTHKPAATAQTAAAEPDTLLQHYDAARTFGLSGDQQHAIVEYRAFLAGALRRTANARSKEGKTSEAIGLFKEALAIAPNDADLHIDYAVACLDAESFDTAKAQAEEAVRLAPDNTRAQYILGRALYGVEDYAGAKTHLETAVAAKANFEMGYSLALTYLKLKDLNRARLLFDEMISGLGDSAALHIYFGHAYWETDNYDKAIDEYKKALAKDPKIPQAHYFLGLALLSRDEDKGWDEVAEQDREEIKVSPNDFRPHYDLGNIALKQHRADEAERELKRASELAPQDPDPLIFLGELFAGQGRLQDAEAAMRRAIQLTPDPSRARYQINRAHYVLGRVLIQTGHKEEGAQELKLSAELRERAHPSVERSGGSEGDIAISAKDNEVKPQDGSDRLQPDEQQKIESYLSQLKLGIGDAYNNLGVAAASQNDFTAALDYFRKASQWDPSLAMLDRNLGMAAFYDGQFEEAVTPLYRQLQQKPDDVRVRAALGLSYFTLGKYDATLETLGPVKDHINEDAGLGVAYAASLVKTNKFDEGMARLKALEQDNSQAAEVHVAIGEAYADQKLFGQAVDEYRKALAIDPQQARTHFLLGLALMHQETQSDAAQEFRASLKLDPANVSAKYHLAYSLIQLQRKDEGQALLREVVQQDPHYADAFYQLGKLQLENGDTKAAIGNLETAVHLSPNSEYVHYQLAMAYRRDSRADEATREMQAYEALKQHRRGDHEAAAPN